MKKDYLFIAIVSLISSTAFAAQPDASSAPATPPNESQVPAADCTQMTPQEKNFASQLTDPNNRMLFCQKMNVDQRAKVMGMTNMDASGNRMSSDEAVRQYANQNNMMTPAAPAKKSTSGGCPVK